MKRKFWNWARDADSGERELFIDGLIDDDDSWFYDNAVTPAQFRDELFAGKGDVTVWINSPGGSAFAASQMYTMLMDYTGNVTVKIHGFAASAASVIAMAGGKVLMSPTAMMLIHNPMTVAIGDKTDMAKATAFLDEAKESIVNAYQLKTGLSRAKISRLMDDETPMNVHKAIALGFADDVLEPSPKTPNTDANPAENQDAIVDVKHTHNLNGHNHHVHTGMQNRQVSINALQERLKLISGRQ